MTITTAQRAQLTQRAQQYLPETGEIWRPTLTRGGGGGRTTGWRLQARVPVSRQAITRPPLDTVAAASQAIVVGWRIWTPRGTDAQIADVVRWGASGQAVGATVDDVTFRALPGQALRIDDVTDATNSLLLTLMAREVTT